MKVLIGAGIWALIDTVVLCAWHAAVQHGVRQARREHPSNQHP